MKALFASFWFTFGGTLALLLVNYAVIAANVGDLSTTEGQAVYNLHDHLLTYILIFGAATLISLVTLVAMKFVKRP